ncbi:MAG: hypothetical protein AB1894_26315 [Chloroflexota bacterium]
MSKWITRKVLKEISEAVHSSADRSSYVFYITSKGGEGKTILLRQVGIELGSKDGISPCFPWTGIMDLYHADVNTNSGLEARLSRVLDTAGQFHNYQFQRERFSARREAGLEGSELEVTRAQMARVFAECFNKASVWSRLVIAFDTTERIQYEVDEVQRLCGIEGESTTVRNWLLDQLNHWQNCVVLLVGRPEKQPYLGKALSEALAGNPYVKYREIELGGFDKGEAKEYFTQAQEAFPDLATELDPVFCEQLRDVTNGSPIRLDLALEIMRHGLGFDRFRRSVLKGNPEQVRKEIDKLLIQHIVRGEPDNLMRQVLRYLAVARKGLDAETACSLAGEDDVETWRQRLETAAERFFFVKRHPEDDRLFLHDEMYQFCDAHWLRPDEAQHLSRQIVQLYDERIAQAGDEREKKELQVESLFYRLRANPRDGYHWYVRLAEFAIRSAEMGFELRLRNEVIAFLNSDSPIDQQLLRHTPDLIDEFNCDSTSNWVKRLMIRGENTRASAVADQVQSQRPDLWYSGPGADLTRMDLAVYHAQALFYTANIPQAVELLNKAIAELEGQQDPEQLALQEEIDPYFSWRRNLVLGRAHNNLGYVNSTYLGHLHKALRELRKALPYFRVSELSEELANTSDNMGRVFAMLRRQTRAEALVDDGLRLRQQLRRDYRIGLSLVSRAIVHIEFSEPHRARKISQQALNIFEGLDATRGKGLALIVLGRALRELAKLQVEQLYTYAECVDFLRDSTGYLKNAISIFERTEEKLRLVEAHNELGCVFRERARLELENPAGQQLMKAVSSEAIAHFVKTVELAENLELSVWIADTCEDLAQVYMLLQDYEAAKTWLDRAEAAMPERYKYQAAVKYTEIPEDEVVELFWPMLGKIELLRGNRIFDAGTNSGKIVPTRELLREVLDHYVLSVAYFERYSDRAVGIGATFRQMFDRIKHLSYNDLCFVQAELPLIAARYVVNIARLERFFEDTLGLA